jgi:hypothetical protein
MRFTKEELEQKPLDPGNYKGMIRGVRELNSGGREMVLVDLVLNTKGFQDREITDFFMIGGVSDDVLRVSRPRLKRFIQSMEIDLESGREVDFSSLRGVHVEVNVNITKIQGQSANSVSSYRRLSSGPTMPDPSAIPSPIAS